MVGKIAKKGTVATGTLSVTFEVSAPFSFKPGQYVFVTLPKLNYPDERGPRRQFSINNSPSQKGIITITTRLSDSGFKKTLNELAIGTEVELGPIAGIFTLPESTDKPLVLIAGGIGITPFLSILRYLREVRLPYNITLIYSNRNQAAAAYLEELQLLSTYLPTYKLIATMTEDPDWEGESRKVDASFIADYLPKANSYLYMVVGPPGMVDAIRAVQAEVGVSEENIKFENFTGY